MSFPTNNPCASVIRLIGYLGPATCQYSPLNYTRRKQRSLSFFQCHGNNNYFAFRTLGTVHTVELRTVAGIFVGGTRGTSVGVISGALVVVCIGTFVGVLVGGDVCGLRGATVVATIGIFVGDLVDAIGIFVGVLVGGLVGGFFGELIGGFCGALVGAFNGGFRGAPLGCFIGAFVAIIVKLIVTVVPFLPSA